MSDDDLNEFKIEYYTADGGKYNSTIQVPHLAKLADGYVKRYRTVAEADRTWADLLKVY